MARKKPKGWVKEPVRHGLAAKGIKTGRMSRESLWDFPGRFEAKIIQFPSGKWGLVGSIPAGLADRTFDTEAEAAQAFVDEKSLPPTFYEKWPHPGPREAKRLAELREIVRKEEQRERRQHAEDMDRERVRRRMALHLADEARSNLIVGGEVGVLVATAVDHLQEGDYEGAYAAFASAREEASAEEPLPGIADDLREYEIRARDLWGR